MIKIKCVEKEEDSNECEDFSFGNIIDLNQVEYEGKEIRFHTPAEHTINGESYEMEI